MKDKKKTIAILGLGMGKGHKKDKSEDKSDDYSDLDAVAEDIISAVRKKDASALTESLKEFVKICTDDDYESDDDEDEDE